jgi:hypothetical protein
MRSPRSPARTWAPARGARRETMRRALPNNATTAARDARISFTKRNTVRFFFFSFFSFV